MYVQVEGISAATKQLLSGSEQAAGSIVEIGNIASETSEHVNRMVQETQKQFDSLESIAASINELHSVAGELISTINSLE